ncbi:putative salicylate hydroxylase [Aspergillus ibericus CBS 121593]|uniref:Salicylate hydroxylase n=1 Tax=Aspergillus ibericus CBS 121593 TaxID=1448316 RepID=A0A395GX06_9EURO|nr:salicylate hydroxylase [Aspergillus ibericus CBS 121593]RAK99952.1 salicylate hydroxylase [Aspergillus ibericus CBS 121593]
MPSVRPVKEFTVAIVGGGIGGLTLVAGLLRRGVPVRIYESAPAFKEIGLGVTIGPAAHRAMPLIDPQIRELYDSLITTHADSPGYERFQQTWFEVIWATGDKAGEVLLDLKALPSGQTTVRRADFLDALVSLIPPEIANFGKRLVSLSETPTGVDLLFEDGTSATADVVVGCDGIRSTVKEFVVPEEYQHSLPRYSGMYGYRAVLDMETMVKAVGDHRARVSSMYLGQGAYGITYPIARAKKVNAAFYTFGDKWDSETWIRPASKSDMIKDLRPVMGGSVDGLLQHMPDTSQWAIFEQTPISTFVRSRVAIMGDAAHSCTPHQGAGAGQAIEDSHVLAELLGDARVVRVEDAIAAFQAYDAIRRPRSQKVVETSKQSAYLLSLCLDGVGADEMKFKLALQERLHWLWDIDVEEQVERARAYMLERMMRGSQGVSDV